MRTSCAATSVSFSFIHFTGLDDFSLSSQVFEHLDKVWAFLTFKYTGKCLVTTEVAPLIQAAAQSEKGRGTRSNTKMQRVSIDLSFVSQFATRLVIELKLEMCLISF